MTSIYWYLLKDVFGASSVWPFVPLLGSVFRLTQLMFSRCHSSRGPLPDLVSPEQWPSQSKHQKEDHGGPSCEVWSLLSVSRTKPGPCATGKWGGISTPGWGLFGEVLHAHPLLGIPQVLAWWFLFLLLPFVSVNSFVPLLLCISVAFPEISSYLSSGSPSHSALLCCQFCY